MRLLLLGSGAFGVPTFDALSSEHDIAAVVTQPDRPAGRHRHPTPTDVARWAEGKSLPVWKHEDVNQPAVVEAVRDLGVDASVVIAFGQKLGEPLIGAAGELAVNLHGSLLPALRGAAPVNWAILEGHAQAGVTVISLAQRMDAGLAYARASTPIDPLETAGELHDRLALLGPAVMARVLSDQARGELKGEPQDESQVTRAPKLSREMATVDFSQPAELVRRRIHGLTPWPGVKVTWRRVSGEPLTLTLRRVRDLPDHATSAPPGEVIDNQCVATGQGVVRLLELQAPGGKPMPVDQFINGRPLTPGDRLEP